MHDQAMTSVPSVPQRTVQIAFLLLALVYATYSIATLLQWTPHALYADQWWQYYVYLAAPFPENVLSPESGHRLFLPNLIAWAELQLLGGNLWLQLTVGIACALGVIGSIALVAWRDAGLTNTERAVCVLLATFAVLWLGNARTLCHTGELLHTMMTMLWLMLGLAAIVRGTSTAPAARRGLMLWLVAAACGLAATFTFGYGLATFVGLLACAAVRGGLARELGIVGVGLALAAALYFGLPGTGGVTGWLHVEPSENLLVALRWLGAPPVALVPYLWDPSGAGILPAPLQAPAHDVAVYATQHYADFRTSILPQGAFGAFGCAIVLAASWRELRRAGSAPPLRALGLGIAWFGLAAAGIIALTRLQYFREFPGQIYANRYLPWPCLFWLGVALCVLGDDQRRRIAARAVIVMAALIAVLGWPGERGGRIFAKLTHGLVENTAAGMSVGVLEPGTLGETIADILKTVRPKLLQSPLAILHDEATRALGHPVAASMAAVPVQRLELTAIKANAFGVEGMRIALRADDPKLPSRLTVVDGTGIAIGIVARDARQVPGHYTGYVLGTPDASRLRVCVPPPS